jgi:hypothetical protein
VSDLWIVLYLGGALAATLAAEFVAVLIGGAMAYAHQRSISRAGKLYLALACPLVPLAGLLAAAQLALGLTADFTGVAVLLGAALVGPLLFLLTIAALLAPVKVALRAASRHRERVSPVHRARAALRRGEIREGFHWHAEAGTFPEIRKAIVSRVPDWPVRATLLDAIGELTALERGSRAAGNVGALLPVASGFRQGARDALDALWGSAERIDAVAAQGYMSGAIQRGLEREREKLERVCDVARQSRERLAELTLSTGGHGDLDAAARELVLLREVAREVADL